LFSVATKDFGLYTNKLSEDTVAVFCAMMNKL
jgi:hypothetical protein